MMGLEFMMSPSLQTIVAGPSGQGLETVLDLQPGTSTTVAYSTSLLAR